MKKLTIFILIVLGVILGWYFLKDNKTSFSKKGQEGKEFCFYLKEKNSRGFYDKQVLHFILDGESVSGEYEYMPAEKDSKVGDFTGIVGMLDQDKMGRRIDAIWNTLAEGTLAKEQLFIDYGEGSAAAFFGEQYKDQNGIYVYKDKANIIPNKTMSQVECADLGEIEVVEGYFKSDINSIATNKPVLGGTWYVVDLKVNPSTKSGEVVYEDGHIQSKANFTYSFTNEGMSVDSFSIIK